MPKKRASMTVEEKVMMSGTTKKRERQTSLDHLKKQEEILAEKQKRLERQKSLLVLSLYAKALVTAEKWLAAKDEFELLDEMDKRGLVIGYEELEEKGCQMLREQIIADMFPTDFPPVVGIPDPGSYVDDSVTEINDELPVNLEPIVPGSPEEVSA